ncbi:GGDEF domain-containing protein [Agarivorans sp. TSD2052]|uniref:GGDEF domain-containing protein n=1 Tax=Agarivorans sp. TSD2052 TaxID=2937286 RepID=UPI00200C3C83|nr:GGDEF domain-containing protein [Agarivorans sp. TSD2052]UPW18404.1 GGDEF domain-containing protein [Agarivorans sp. TSD2052]
MSRFISLRFGLWFAMFGILASIVTATVSYHESRGLLAESAERELATTTQILTRGFIRTIDEIVKDTLFLSAIPQTTRYSKDTRQQLSDIFKQKLRLNPSYFQIRFISAADFGKELVRVDRLRDGLVAIEDSLLEEKSHYPYVFRTLRLPAGDVYLSAIDIHTERGVELGLHQPTLKVAAPVHIDGQTIGLIVINVGLENLFSQLQADLPEGVEIYLANQQGDYLVNPNPDKQFGFHFGHRYLIQHDFPRMESMFDNYQALTYVLDSSTDIRYQRAVSFTPLFYGPPASQRLAVMGLASPLPTLGAIIDSLAGSMIKVSLALSLLGLLTSLLFARVLSRPIRNMVSVVQAYRAGEIPVTKLLPSQRSDEIGLLANTFISMSQQINTQIDELKNNAIHLRYMASHDSLTDLPNRGLFIEQLKSMIHRAQRHNTTLAVVFIDLDNFKQINDSFGHDVGDRLLKQVAKVLHDTVRAEDCVARFAGDEFMLALEGIKEGQDASEIASKVLRRLAQEINLGPQPQPVHASIGISLYPVDGQDPEVLIRNADVAMYRAKAKGRNQYSYYAFEKSL